MTLKREIKNLPFEVKTTNEEGDYFTFEGYASTFGNLDYGNDVIVKGAFLKSLKETPEVPVLWQHRMSEPVGKSVQLREDEGGLYIKAILPKDDTLVNGRIMPQMKVGSIKEMSIGFFSKEADVREDGIRYIKEIELYEVSLVTKAMNPKALVSNFKSLESLKDVEQTLKDFGLSNTEAKTFISKVKEFSLACDAQEKAKNQRDAEAKKLLESIQELTNFIKNNK